jgi:hypothetical protein
VWGVKQLLERHKKSLTSVKFANVVLLRTDGYGPRSDENIKRMVRYMKKELALESAEFRVPRLYPGFLAPFGTESTAQHLEHLAHELEVKLEENEYWDFAKCSAGKLVGVSDGEF